MAKKAPAPSAIAGCWQIISLTTDENGGLNDESQAFIEFDEQGAGSFHFGSLQGVMDRCRTKPWQGKRVAQFSWDGEDEADGTPLHGIGWVILDGEQLTGTISVSTWAMTMNSSPREANVKGLRCEPPIFQAA